MSVDTDVARVAARCRKIFPLSELTLPEEYRYASVGHCILDAVFSLAVNYGSTRKVVKRYCEKRAIKHFRPREALPPQKQQERLSSFVSYIESIGPRTFAKDIVENRQRTSPRSGILKADASLQFARVLRSFKVQYLQDLPAHANDDKLDRQLREIKGMKSGIAIDYFWMLAGSEDLVKADRMIIRFVSSALRRPFNSPLQASSLVIAATESLRKDYPTLTARMVDYAIWEYQRSKPKVRRPC